MSASYLAFPVRVVAGGFATIQDGSEAHAADMATHVVACQPGQRGLAPDYGLPDPAGIGVDAEQVAATIEDLEPELEVLAVDVVDAADPAGEVVDLRIELRFNGRGDA